MKYSHIMRSRGTSYFFASMLFPRKIRSEVMTLYGFVRFFDDIVDHKGIDEKKDADLMIRYRKEADEAWEGKKGTIPVIYDRMQLARKKGIQKIWVDAFLDAMFSDTKKKRYNTYEELKGYMYGSAEVVGLMMIQLIGYDAAHTDEVIEGAKQLAEAMQYTNFLRDIEEDRKSYGRIYMPEDELEKYGMKPEDLIASGERKVCLPPQRKTFMKDQVKKTRSLYKQAEQRMQYLDEEGRMPVLMASRMYEGILDTIEARKYETFGSSNKTSLRRKIRIFFSTLRRDIPLRHRVIWMIIAGLFAMSIVGFMIGMDTRVREIPAITTAIFVIATLPIIASGKDRRKKMLFIASMRGIEWIGHTTHIPFGEYAYQNPWTTRGILDIPVFIAFSRLLLISIASNMTKNRRGTVIMVVALDMVLEPFATMMRYRTRNGDYMLTAPWMNYLSWGIITAISYRIVRRWRISRLRSLLMYLTIGGYAIAVIMLK